MDSSILMQTSSNIFNVDDIKSANNKDEKIDKISSQFSAIFVNEMLKNARKSDVFKDKLFNSDQVKMVNGLYDQQVSLEVTKNHSIGISNLIEAELKGKG